MIRATCAKVSQLARVSGVDELQHVRGVGEAGDPAMLLADAATKVRCNPGGEILAVSSSRERFATKAARALRRAVARDELADLVNEGDGVQVTLALRLAPGEQTVATEHDSVAAGICCDRTLHHHAKLKARALPGNPDQ